MQWLIHRNKHNKHLHVSAVPLSYFHGSIGASCPSFTTLSLLNVKDSVTTRARVVRILKLIHEEGDQAAAQHQPKADEEQAHEPGISPGLVGDITHDLLLAGGAGGHAWVEAQCRVIADILVFAISSFSSLSVRAAGVHWQLCTAALWRSEGSVDVVNLDSIILTSNWYHIRGNVFPSVRTHCAAQFIFSCLLMESLEMMCF